jgi:hypothetical protein
MNLRTKWNIITYTKTDIDTGYVTDDIPIALISEADSWRIPDQMRLEDSEINKYEKFRVRSMKEGLDYLINF